MIIKMNTKVKMFNECYSRDSVKEVPKIHPTQKPVNLLEQLIKTFTDEGDVVIDPCAGSGTTLLVARRNNRHSYGIKGV